MKIIILILISLLTISSAWSQSDDINYRQMLNDGLRLMDKGEYSAALRLFTGAEGFASNQKQEKEIAYLQERLQDSVQVVFKRAIENAKKYEESNSYLTAAINDLKKLIPSDGLEVDNVYSWMGYCYEHLNQPNAAIEQYQKGVEQNEIYSALQLANLLNKQNDVPIDSISKLYRMAAPQYKEAYDRLGDLYRSSNPDTAKDYYKKSGTEYGNTMIALISREGRSAIDASDYTNNSSYSKPSYTESNYSYPPYGSIGGGLSDIWEIEDDIKGYDYDYSPHFPLAISYNRTLSHFLISGEMGFTCSKKKYEWNNNGTAQPLMYLMAAPGLYCKYVSIQCGIGALFDIRKKVRITHIEDNDSISVNVTGDDIDDVNIDIHHGSEYQKDKTTTVVNTSVNILLKPSITGYIPIGDGKYITISAGYIFVPKLKELNGFTCGIGFRWTIN